MADYEYVDRWAAASAAMDERLAGLPPRPMLTRAEANAKANEFLRNTGVPDVAVSAMPNPLQGLWIVDYQDPRTPDDRIDGGGPLIVPTDEPVYSLGSWIPPRAEELGIEEPEAWTHDRGDHLLSEDWISQLGGELEKDYWYELLSFVAEERGRFDVFPPPSLTFAAFDLTPFSDVRVVILGQDPYPTPGNAHGLAFSVPVGVPVPDSLRNIHRELEADLGVPAPDHGSLVGWAEQGVLLLNTALTVRAGSDDDHKVHRKWRWKRQGWETFTDAVITAINAKPEPIVFMLWGEDAKRKKPLIDGTHHVVLESAHPSPLSASRHGFFGSRPFGAANKFLKSNGQGEIDWSNFGVASA